MSKEQLTPEQVEALVKENEKLKKQLAEKQKEQSNFKLASDATVSHEIEVESLDGDQFHATGEKFKVGEKNAVRLAELKKVKIVGKFKDPDNEKKAKALGLLSLIFFALLSFTAPAQNLIKFYNPLGTNIESDTVTNTGTAYVSSRVMDKRDGFGSTVVQVVVTKISGTVGGTISLHGSLDGTNYNALVTEETQTALATITAADASSNYHWRLKGCPFPYLRVSWTGTGTMSASFTAKAYRDR